MRRRAPSLFSVVLALLALLVLVVLFGSGFYTEWLWFSNLGFEDVFATGIVWRWAIGLSSGLLLATFLWVNLNLALAGRVGTLPGIIELPIGPMIAPRRIRRYLLGGAAVVGGFIGLNASAHWLGIASYLRQVPFGVADPIFGRDVAHYVFTLPVMSLLYQYLVSALVLTGIGVLLIYLLTGDLSFDVRRVRLSARARSHVSVLLAGFFATKAIGYRVNLYRLMYSPRGQVFGASYTDVHAQAPALRMLFWITLAVALLLLLNLRLRRTNLILAGVGLMIGVSFILGTLYPTFVQQFTVEPDELRKEKPFIAHNIEFTRRAWDLDSIQEVDFQLEGGLTMADIELNRDTIDNIRLWDHRPLYATFGQLQEIRGYYGFADVDVDRYRFGDKYRQVALAVRELDITRLPERTWINQHLVFTHGFGVVMSPVNEATPEGLPVFWSRDIPPVLAGLAYQYGLPLDQVRSYYGELTRHHVIVNTKQPEFDFPLGAVNATYHFTGQGGVRLSSPLVRLAFAVRMRSHQILLSDAITAESRIKFHREITDRARRIAPFLVYDRDPYPVIYDGRLYWIIDAYTMTAGYPYSEPLPAVRANYVRNSVKVIIDAYDGFARFFLFDPHDPLAATLNRVFPGLFTPMAEMPEGLRQHLRFPQDLFGWQSQMMLTYHMQDPVVFYNKEDVWVVPTEMYQGRMQPVEPHYLIMRLPGQDHPEFVLLTTFVPLDRQNMIAWLAARNDGDALGQRILYRLPKAELIFGPAQIEARIDQDAEISRDLTLWGQRGSEVIRGHLLVIPINGSLLYVEPIYLQAEATRLPELRRVVVVYRDHVVMAETLELALREIFGDGAAPPPVGVGDTVEELAARAGQLHSQAEQALRGGNWAEYGRLQVELGQVLQKLRNRLGVQVQ